MNKIQIHLTYKVKKFNKDKQNNKIDSNYFTYMEQASVEERDRTKNRIKHYHLKYLAKNINFKKTFLNLAKEMTVHSKYSRT